MQVTWRGQTWGVYGSSTIVKTSNGLEDFKGQAANLAGQGHGATRSPLWQTPGGWILELTVFADSDAAMAAELDAIRAVTAGGSDPMAEYPFDFTMPGEVTKTAFAYVTDRQIPTDWTSHDRLDGVTLQIAFEATDPMIYGAEVVKVFENDEVWSFTSPGWVPSERWQWVVPGPATYPRITWSNGTDQAVVRLGQGFVDTGENLNVNLKPRSLVTTVGGTIYNRYGYFDGGNTNVPPPWFRIPPGAQTITFHAATGGAESTFRYRPAMP